ncbi:TPA: hypothetical protein JLG89_003977 [Escherichia coli]|nr:hypothetical protein [Escherichia coli]
MNVDFQQINSILDAHDQAFRRQSRIATALLILIVIPGVVSSVGFLVKSSQLVLAVIGIPWSIAIIVFIYINFVWVEPGRFLVLSRRKLLQLMREAQDYPDVRLELLNRLLSGKKLTGLDEKEIRSLWWERQDEAEESETRQRERDAIRTFIGEDDQ